MRIKVCPKHELLGVEAGHFAIDLQAHLCASRRTSGACFISTLFPPYAVGPQVAKINFKIGAY